MDLVLAAALLALVFAVLAYPLYRTRTRAPLFSTNPLGDGVAQRDGIYATLRDLDQDYQIGKLDEADYRARREKYLGRAALILREIDAEKGAEENTQAQSEAIEAEVAALRQARQEAGREPTGYCRQCGQPYKAGDLFCAKCGQALS